MKRAFVACCLLLLISVPGLAEAADEIPEWVERSKISGLFYADYYGIVSNHDEEIEGENGFWFRRIYFTFDTDVNDNLSVRLRAEANSPGDFETGSKLDPFIKDAYIKWKGGRQDLYIGLSPTPTWSHLEKTWGYRSVEKAPLDLQKFGSSRDMGFALKGRFDKEGFVRYHAMFGNGSGTKAETDDGKKGMVAVSVHPTEKFVVEAYGDFENRPDRTNRSTYHVWCAYQGERHRYGLQFARQHRETGPGDSIDLDLASIFGVFGLTGKLNILGRVDRMFDPNPDGDKIAYIPFDPTDEWTFALLGLDFKMYDALSVIPNIEAVFYDEDDGIDRDNDLIARLTFYARF